MKGKHQTRVSLPTTKPTTSSLARLLLFFCLHPATVMFAQQMALRTTHEPAEATKLAELMCRQIPNVGTILDVVRIPTPIGTTPPAPLQEPFITDDVYDALLRLGPYSLPCLTNRLIDIRWMPDPRSEPLLGVPVVGDVAYIILRDKGMHDVMPDLMHRKPDDLRMDEYFIWPRVGNHRQQLQNAVRTWLTNNPGCCGAPPALRETAPPRMKFRMTAVDLEKARIRFSGLRPGMSPGQVENIVGKPDAIDQGLAEPGHQSLSLLGFCANDRNENRAYIYFIERWTEDIARRDPLRDRYLIVFFTAQGKFTRMFSNVADIPAIFPSGQAVWEGLMWGPPTKTIGARHARHARFSLN